MKEGQSRKGGWTRIGYVKGSTTLASVSNQTTPYRITFENLQEFLLARHRGVICRLCFLEATDAGSGPEEYR